jgi:LuxR family transcriptional regulator, maltose regulon positive regulatory protein
MGVVPAKVCAPSGRDVFPRQRLFERIDGALERSIIWLVGPPGAGKTTLAASYVKARGRHHLWYQVDATDGDVANLFHYLGLAAGRCALPAWSGDPGVIPAFARRWFEGLFQQLPADTTLVFDDHHEAPAGSLWQVALREGLAAVPPSARVIVTSRADPPPGLARLIAAQRLIVIDWSELRLSAEEAAGIAHMISADRADARAIELADGWVAGLVLLLAGGAAAEVAGVRARQDIFNYFAAEAFAHLDEPSRRVLLATTFARRIDDALAVRIAGERAAAVLDDIARRGLFLERVAADAHRCHALFRAFLLERAVRDLAPAEIARLRRDTAAHLAETGDSDEAFALYVEAGELDAAAALIVREAPALLAQRRSGTLAARLGRLPAERVDADPWLLYWRAVLALGASPTEAAGMFDRAHALAADPVLVRLAWAGKAQAIVFEGDDFSQLDDWLARWPTDPAPLPPEVDLQIETARLLALQWRRPGAPETRAAAERTLALFHQVRDVEPAVMAGGLLVIYHVLTEGDVARASIVLDVLRSAARRREATPLACATHDHAEAIYEWARGDVQVARARIDEALAIAIGEGIAVWKDQSWAMGVSAALTVCDVDGAARYLAEMAAAAQRSRFAIGNYHFFVAWHAYLCGEHARVERALEVALAQGDAAGHAFARLGARIIYGQFAALTGRDELARRLLGEARELTDASDNRLMDYSCSVAEAIAALRRGEREITAHVTRAFTAAREGGLCNMFFLLREPMAAVCAYALEHGIETAHVRTIVRRLDLRPEVPPVDAHAWPWRLEVATLGGFRITADGEHVASEAKAQRAPLRLLQALLAHGGRGVPDRTLIDALWPEAEGDAGRRVFDTTLHRLRKLLAHPDVLRLEGRRLHLDGELAWTDVWALERRLAELDATSDSELAARLHAAVALYAGPFLADDVDEAHWVLAARDRLRTRVGTAIGRAARRLVQRGQHAEATAIAASVRQADPAIRLPV